MKKEVEDIFLRLPIAVSQELSRLPDPVLDQLEEIRMKINRPILVYAGGKEYKILLSGARSLNQEELEQTFFNAMEHSVYAYQDEIASGYVTLEGGHRIGVCGKTVMEQGRIITIKEISSLNIRRCREIRGISDKFIRYLMKNRSQVYNTVLVSPPKCGKTTLLRDIIRNLSTMGLKVGVCDERSEIAGAYRGVVNFDLGLRTDVMDGCPKHQAMFLLLRAMSPDIIATDEIGRLEDISAIESAICAGVGLITTIHGSSYEDVLASRIGHFIEKDIFQRLLFLTNDPATGHVSCITDSRCRRVYG